MYRLEALLAASCVTVAMSRHVCICAYIYVCVCVCVCMCMCVCVRVSMFAGGTWNLWLNTKMAMKAKCYRCTCKYNTSTTLSLRLNTCYKCTSKYNTPTTLSLRCKYHLIVYMYMYHHLIVYMSIYALGHFDTWIWQLIRLRWRCPHLQASSPCVCVRKLQHMQLG